MRCVNGNPVPIRIFKHNCNLLFIIVSIIHKRLTLAECYFPCLKIYMRNFLMLKYVTALNKLGNIKLATQWVRRM